MPGNDAMGAAVRRRRTDAGLSQSELADLAGVSRGTIRNIEANVVAPNRATWVGIEAVLAWAPGSLDLLEEGNDPIEVVPSPVLATILKEASTGAFGGPSVSIDKFRTIITSADASGRLDQDRFNELTDLMLHIQAPEEEIEELLAKLPPPTEAIRPKIYFHGQHHKDPDALAPGDQMRHENFGVGTVRTVHGQRGRTRVRLDFGHEVGEKEFFLRSSPMKKVTEGANVSPSPEIPPAQNPPRANETRLPEDVQEVIADGQIIDYDVTDPDDSDNLAVVTLLVKKTDGRLSRNDRRYIAGVWSALEDAINGNTPPTDDPWATTNSSFAAVRGSAQARTAPRRPAQERPAKKPAPPKSTGGGFSDEPPF